jgi:hypothetical protein
MGKETPIICGIQFDVLFRKFPASPAEWPHGEVQGCVQYNFIFRHDPRVIFRYVLAYTQYGVLSRSFSNSGHRKCSDVKVPAIGVDWSHRSVGAHLRTYWGVVFDRGPSALFPCYGRGLVTYWESVSSC